jgi:hypothetical protein
VEEILFNAPTNCVHLQYVWKQSAVSVVATPRIKAIEAEATPLADPLGRVIGRASIADTASIARSSVLSCARRIKRHRIRGLLDFFTQLLLC